MTCDSPSVVGQHPNYNYLPPLYWNAIHFIVNFWDKQTTLCKIASTHNTPEMDII